MLSSFLKYVGFGMVATGVQDGGLDDNPNSVYYNSAIAVLGFVGWAVGTYLESRESDAPQFWPQNSTDLIRRTLNYAAGAGVVCGLTHLIKHAGPTSAAMGTLGAGIFLPVATQELSLAAIRPTTKMKWEKLRFAILTAGDFLLGSGMKKVVNGEHLDIFSIVALPLGFALTIGEGVYTYQSDIKPLAANVSNQQEQNRMLADVFRVLNKRMMKLTVGLGTLFTLQDIIQGSTDKYSIANDVYVMLTNIFLFAALLEMRKLAVAHTLEENNLQPALVINDVLDVQYTELSDAENNSMVSVSEFRGDSDASSRQGDHARDSLIDMRRADVSEGTLLGNSELPRKLSR
jgi:hypothetical protein